MYASDQRLWCCWTGLSCSAVSVCGLSPSEETPLPQVPPGAPRGDARAWHLSTHFSQPGLFPPSLRSTYWQRLWVMLPRTGSGSSGRAKSRLCSLLRTSSSASTAFRAPQWDIVPPGLRATVLMGWGRGHYFCTVGAGNLEQTALESAQLSFHYYQNKKCIMWQKDFMLLMLRRGFFPTLVRYFY